jgi:hypothetical protein
LWQVLQNLGKKYLEPRPPDQSEALKGNASLSLGGQGYVFTGRFVAKSL